MIYRLLIVDDEPHVIESMVSLLESQSDLPLDIYTAYSGQQAINMMHQGKIDILITDIRMPDISGIELVDIVNRLWPVCKTIFLTAYPNFEYAYHAIRRHVISYILKTESDDVIINEIRKALTTIHEEFIDQQASIQTGSAPAEGNNCVDRDLLMYLLSRPNQSREKMQPYLEILGFRKPIEHLHLALGQIRNGGAMRGDECANFVSRLISDYMGAQLRHYVCRMNTDGILICLLQFDWNAFRDMTVDSSLWLSGILETIQSASLAATGLDLSFAASARIYDPVILPSAYTRGLLCLDRLGPGTERYVYVFSPESGTPQSNFQTSYNIIQVMKDYIDANILGDVSLMRLSALTGYNSVYLSSLFHQQTGEQLYKYFNRKKLDLVAELLRNPDLSIETVAERSGFNSRSYFNRFIKKETGLTPKKYRVQLLNHSGGISRPSK